MHLLQNSEVKGNVLFPISNIAPAAVEKAEDVAAAWQKR